MSNNSNRDDESNIYLDHQEWALLFVFVVPVVSMILFIGLCIIRKKTNSTEVKQVNNSKSFSIANSFKSERNRVEEIHIPQQPLQQTIQQQPHPLSESISTPSGYELNGNDFFSTKASLPKLSLPKSILLCCVLPHL